MSSLFKPWSGGVSRSNKVVLTQISQQLSYVPSLLIFAGVFLFLTLSLAVLPVGIFSRSSNFILIGCFSVSVGNECPNTCQSSPGDKGKCAQTTVFNSSPCSQEDSQISPRSVRDVSWYQTSLSTCVASYCKSDVDISKAAFPTYTKSIPTHLLGKMPAATRCLHGKSAADLTVKGTRQEEKAQGPQYFRWPSIRSGALWSKGWCWMEPVTFTRKLPSKHSVWPCRILRTHPCRTRPRGMQP